jgi:hypothetical protein
MGAAAKKKGTSARPARQLVIRLHQLHDRRKGGEGVGVAVMIFEDRESAIAANDKVLKFVQASLLDLNLGDPEIIAGEVLVDIESDA